MASPDESVSSAICSVPRDSHRTWRRTHTSARTRNKEGLEDEILVCGLCQLGLALSAPGRNNLAIL